MDKAWLDKRQACKVVLETVVAAFFPRVFFRVFGGSRHERYGVIKLPLVHQLAPVRDEQKQDAKRVQDNDADQCVGGDQQSLVDQPVGSRLCHDRRQIATDDEGAAGEDEHHHKPDQVEPQASPVFLRAFEFIHFDRYLQRGCEVLQADQHDEQQEEDEEKDRMH